MGPPKESAREDTRFDARALERWVSETASRKNIPEDELLDELLSSYWIIEELSRMLEVPGGDAIEETPVEYQPDIETEQSDESPPTIAEQLERLKEQKESPELSERDSSTVDGTTLNRALDVLVDAASVGIDDSEEEVDTRIGSLETQIAELSDTIGELEETKVSQSELEEAIEVVRTRQQSHEAAVNQEFDDLEPAIEYLIEKVESLEDRVTVLYQTRNEPSEAFESFMERRERLLGIKQDAQTIEVETATCEYCEEPITVPNLMEPVCPHCDRDFVGIDGPDAPFLLRPFRPGTLITAETESFS